jgi:hypothetical protein
MRFHKEVSSIEVKRCFVFSSLYAKSLRQKNVAHLSQSKRLVLTEQKVLSMTEAALDKKIGTEYKKRLRLYNKCAWHIGTFTPTEVGMWKGAGGLPVDWTKDTLAHTAMLVKKNLHLLRAVRGRAKTVPLVIAQGKERLLVQKHRYLLPIVAPGGTMGRRGLSKTRGDLDDGNMRSLGLTLAGARSITAYIGTV